MHDGSTSAGAAGTSTGLVKANALLDANAAGVTNDNCDCCEHGNCSSSLNMDGKTLIRKRAS